MNLSGILAALRAYGRTRRMLRRTEHLTLQERETLQLRKLQQQVRMAWEEIPFYRHYWEQSGFAPGQLQTLSDMRRIPCIDKQTVREHLGEMLNPHYPADRLSAVTTGGTTGMPMKFYLDNYEARGKETAYQVWGGRRYWHYRYGRDRVAVLRGSRIPEALTARGIYWQRSRRDRGWEFSSFHLSDATYPHYLRRLREIRPRFIKAYPSSIAALCLLMKRHGDRGIPGLRGVICSSETLYDSHRALIREVLGVPAYSYYGHSEKAVSAFQRGDLMEFAPFYGYTEFLDSRDCPVTGEGETAQVVVTSLDNRYFPFIRYRTGDLVEVADARSLLVHKILGRRQEFVIDRDGNRIPFTCSDEIFWDRPEIAAYQYRQYQPGELVVCLEPADRAGRIDTGELQQQLEKMFLHFDIRIRTTDQIEKTAAGKFRFLEQHIQL